MAFDSSELISSCQLNGVFSNCAYVQPTNTQSDCYKSALHLQLNIPHDDSHLLSAESLNKIYFYRFLTLDLYP